MSADCIVVLMSEAYSTKLLDAGEKRCCCTTTSECRLHCGINERGVQYQVTGRWQSGAAAQPRAWDDCAVTLTSEAYSSKTLDAGEAALMHNHERVMTALWY